MSFWRRLLRRREDGGKDAPAAPPETQAAVTAPPPDAPHPMPSPPEEVPVSGTVAPPAETVPASGTAALAPEAVPISETVRPEAEAAPDAPEARERDTSAAAPARAAGLPERRLSYRVGNLQGQGKRQRQEDGFCFINAMDVTAIRREGLLAVVADGMGGMMDGKVASETALAVLRQEFPLLDRQGDLAVQLRRGVLRAGDAVYERLGGDGGTTVVACLFYEEQLLYVSVGDSFLYLLRDGELLRLNREHNVENELWLRGIRVGSMDPAPGRMDIEHSALTAFLGMDGLSELDELRLPLPLHDGDRFLICSDGVGGVLSEETLRRCLEETEPQDCCAALQRAIIEVDHPYQDNYTALVVHCLY